MNFREEISICFVSQIISQFNLYQTPEILQVIMSFLLRDFISKIWEKIAFVNKYLSKGFEICDLFWEINSYTKFEIFFTSRLFSRVHQFAALAVEKILNNMIVIIIFFMIFLSKINSSRYTNRNQNKYNFLFFWYFFF